MNLQTGATTATASTIWTAYSARWEGKVNPLRTDIITLITTQNKNLSILVIASIAGLSLAAYYFFQKKKKQS